AFRLSAKRPVHPTLMQWLKYCIRGQVRSHGFAARQRYVEDVVAPPTNHVSPADYMLSITGEIS
ncbi:hypothetical protein, partial [Pseudomonas viridiflava]|uniref:hypothetical protein n=1 Tax=Pseudomonas viridiflava TaxID=33069 RepID=UPI00197FCA7E